MIIKINGSELTKEAKEKEVRTSCKVMLATAGVLFAMGLVLGFDVLIGGHFTLSSFIGEFIQKVGGFGVLPV